MSPLKKIATGLFAVAIIAAAASDAQTTEPVRADAGSIDFNRDIRSILSDKCFRCHGPDTASREAGLRLDREESAKADRDGHPAVVPFRPDASELIRRITNSNLEERMPPADSGKTLQPEEIERLRRWVADGAVWSLPWAYVAPQRVETPPVRAKDWPMNWVDHFVLSRLETAGLKPSPPADKTTLIRRLSIDLIGLPPSPDEVDAFLADESADAYERLVDRLLASPHFGERMAVYWLDLVRYADTVGCHGDQDQSISPYRDYVIAAFNANRPFDEFTREQLAGDLLPAATVEQKIATGYNRLLQTNHECGVQVKEWLAIYAADRVRNVSAVWMGATLGCAQCHDHKYDPFTQKDFYSLAAFFADVDETSHLERTEPRPLDALPTSRAPEIELLSDDDRLRLKQLKKRLRDGESNSDQEREDCKAEIDDIHRTARRSMVTVSIEPRRVRILPRGDWRDESGPIVQPAVPEFLGEVGVRGRASRLDLANWLTNGKAGGGLTARVMVNRLWYLLFGEGIARVLDDFGGQGESPSHAELLDRLAIEFVENGWSIKHVMKQIVMSGAYRQSSDFRPRLHELDPLNRLVARQSQFRFPAETVRDSALSVSGLLVRTVGGASVKPYQPSGYYRHLNMPAREYEHHTDERQWRRGVYVHWQRQYVHPMLRAFDAPSREECTAQRARSNTALASLVLLNDPTFTEAARALAVRVLKQGGDSTGARIDFAYRQAASRAADETERKTLTALLDKSRGYYTANSQDADELLAVGMKPVSDDLDRIELAAWTVVARAVLNLHEVYTRN